MNIQKPLCASILSGFPAKPEWFMWEQGLSKVSGLRGRERLVYAETAAPRLSAERSAAGFDG
jgi:hypothetical protein